MFGINASEKREQALPLYVQTKNKKAVWNQAISTLGSCLKSKRLKG